MDDTNDFVDPDGILEKLRQDLERQGKAGNADAAQVAASIGKRIELKNSCRRDLEETTACLKRALDRNDLLVKKCLLLQDEIERLKKTNTKTLFQIAQVADALGRMALGGDN